ncbi:unnamed protein product, partial [Meganyctiphanes norvegica]
MVITTCIATISDLNGDYTVRKINKFRHNGKLHSLEQLHSQKKQLHSQKSLEQLHSQKMGLQIQKTKGDDTVRKLLSLTLRTSKQEGNILKTIGIPSHALKLRDVQVHSVIVGICPWWHRVVVHPQRRGASRHSHENLLPTLLLPPLLPTPPLPSQTATLTPELCNIKLDCIMWEESQFNIQGKHFTSGGDLIKLSYLVSSSRPPQCYKRPRGLRHRRCDHLRETVYPFQPREGKIEFTINIQSPIAVISLHFINQKDSRIGKKMMSIVIYVIRKFTDKRLENFAIAQKAQNALVQSVRRRHDNVLSQYYNVLFQYCRVAPSPKLNDNVLSQYCRVAPSPNINETMQLFKSEILIKQRGVHKDGPIGPAFRDDSVTEERIQHILSEASRAMGVGGGHGGNPLDQDSRSTDSKSPASSTHSPSSPLSRDSRPRLTKFGNDDMPQDKVARIYQEELVKLMSRPQEPQLPLPRDPHFPGILFPFLGQSMLFNRSPDDVKGALDAYHAELSKLQGAAAIGSMGLGAAGLGMGGAGGLGVAGSLSAMGLGAGGIHNGGGAQDLSLPKREAASRIEDEDDRLPSASPFGPARTKPDTTALSSSPLSSLVTPITSISGNVGPCGGGGEELNVTASPLQRMASITNSLMTGNPITSSSQINNKPLKAVLPPITQQQFDMYSQMNTEDIVKKVKEQLSQYSISQRLFGESVLGLSQGSVSDLLARPKPWHMLTQKGREPFIRMKMFLEDDNAVHKLVASQYKIAPEKLMRTGGYSAPPLHLIFPQAPGGSKQHHIKLPADLPKCMESPLPPVGIPPSMIHGMPLPSPHMAGGFEQRMPILDPLRKVMQNNMVGVRVPGPVAPSVYEMAALTQDLDTQTITTKIKEALLANNIGQKLFGEAVLGLSQGSVSELLSKPKPWHMLSIKGREPFIRMQLWLNDPRNMEKLQQLKNERREANKRRRTLDPMADISNDSQDLFQVPSPGGTTKKQRVLFTEEQKEALRLAFALDPYPNLATIEFLSQELQLSTRTLTNWFHNHRMRLKQHPGSPGGSSPTREVPSNTGPASFDPLHFRLLLSQRLMELRKEKGLPPTLPGLAPGFHPGIFPHFPHLAAGGFLGNPFDRDVMGGLDLSMKQENDYDEGSLVGDEDSNMSGGMSPNGGRSDCDEGANRDGQRSPSPSARTGSSSRRKPAAPQWVNPSWQESESKEREVIINGVCVMQTADDYRLREQETVRIEPTPVDEANRSRASPTEQSQNDETEEQQPSASDHPTTPRPETMEIEADISPVHIPSSPCLTQEEPTPSQELPQEGLDERSEEAL